MTDVEAARSELASHGVDVSEVFHDAGGVFHHAGTQERVLGQRAERQELRVVRVVQRPRRQQLVRARDHDALARPLIIAYPNGEFSPYFSISSGTQVGSKNRP